MSLTIIRDFIGLMDGFFNRDGHGGNVHICKHDGVPLNNPNYKYPIVSAFIPENEWASIVTAVSAIGETRASWMMIRALQGAL